jgi:hypothetical protein
MKFAQAGLVPNLRNNGRAAIDLPDNYFDLLKRNIFPGNLLVQRLNAMPGVFCQVREVLFMLSHACPLMTPINFANGCWRIFLTAIKP